MSTILITQDRQISAQLNLHKNFSPQCLTLPDLLRVVVEILLPPEEDLEGSKHSGLKIICKFNYAQIWLSSVASIVVIAFTLF